MIGEETLAKWSQVRQGLLATIEKFSDDELSFLSPDGRSVAEIMLHIAHEEAIEIGWGLTRRPASMPEAYDPKAFGDKSSIIAVLESVHADTLQYADRMDDAALRAPVELAWGQESRPLDMVWHVIEHEVHHRAELSLLLGMLGRDGLDA